MIDQELVRGLVASGV